MQPLYIIKGLTSMFINLTITLIAITFFGIHSNGQCPETNPYCNATNNWVIGDNIGIEWDSDSLLFVNTRNNWIPESSSSFSNSYGELLLYSNGRSLYDQNDSLLATGFLGSSSSTQGSLLVYQNDSSFSMFTTPIVSPVGKYRPLTYNLLSNTGSSNITNRALLSNSSEKLTAFSHQSNQKTWIIGHDDHMTYYFFIHNSLKLIDCPIKSEIGVDLSENFASQQGQLKISHSGKYCGMATHLLNKIQICSVDPESGKIIGVNYSLDAVRPYGLEFSPNEKYLYATLYNGDLIQIDIENKSFLKVGFTKSNTITGIQRGPNNKIYIARVKEPFLDMIEYPDSFGLSCGFKPKAINLPANVNYGLPNFNASYFYTPAIDFAYAEDCWGHTYSFEGRDTFDADGYTWLFEKGSYRDSMLTKHCNYTFADTGKWQVSHIAWNTSRADTVTKTLTIRTKWREDVLGRDTFYCRPFPPEVGHSDTAQGDNKFALTLRAPDDMHCVHWNGEEPNLDETLGPIVDYDHFHTDTLQVDTAGTYIVKLTNKTFCQMWDTITIREIPNPQKPKIQRSGHLLESSVSAYAYRWYLDGQAVEQSSNPTYDPNENGSWQVQLVSEYGCESALSDPLLVGFASVEDLGHRTKDLGFVVYPNPSDGNLSVKVPKSGLYHIQVTDLTGKQIYSISQNLFAEANELEFEFAKGTYILTLTDEDGNMGSKKVEVVH